MPLESRGCGVGGRFWKHLSEKTQKSYPELEEMKAPQGTGLLLVGLSGQTAHTTK